MSLPYHREYEFTTTGSSQIVALDFPGRAVLTFFSVLRADAGSVTATLYNRAFTSAAEPLLTITNDGNGKTQLNLASPLLVKVGDVLTVASTTVSGYNTSHRVTAVVNAFPIGDNGPLTLVTDQTYTADASGGTAALDIPSGEQGIYQVAAALAAAGSAYPNATFINLDPVPNANTGIPRRIYLLLAAAATYRVVLGALVGITQRSA